MKMKSVFASIAAVLALSGAWMVGAALSTPTPAVAQAASAKSIVDDAKRKGLIGETAAGYLAAVSANTPANVINAMNEINIGRKSVYTRLARAQNVQVEVVAALTGEKQIGKAAPGEKIMDKNGAWVTAK